MLDNLVDNAFRYGDERTSVRVRTRVSDHDAILEVRDDGPGISPSGPGTHLRALHARPVRCRAPDGPASGWPSSRVCTPERRRRPGRELAGRRGTIGVTLPRAH